MQSRHFNKIKHLFNWVYKHVYMYWTYMYTVFGATLINEEIQWLRPFLPSAGSASSFNLLMNQMCFDLSVLLFLCLSLVCPQLFYTRQLEFVLLINSIRPSPNIKCVKKQWLFTIIKNYGLMLNTRLKSFLDYVCKPLLRASSLEHNVAMWDPNP